MNNYIYYCLLIFTLLLVVPPAHADDGNIPDMKIELPKSKGTIYQLIRILSEKTGYFFIYDSNIVDNNKKVKIDKGEYSLTEAIRLITQKNDLSIRIVNKHILLYKKQKSEPPVYSLNREKHSEDTIKNDRIIFGGVVLDQLYETPIPAASVSIVNTSIGTISNQDGEFRLVVPDSLVSSNIRFSSLGYQSQEMEVSLLSGQNASIMLEPQVIPLQEIVVRLVNPMEEVERMLQKRKENYATAPVYLTTFYREGVESKKKNTELTEAVLKIYKTGYLGSAERDDVTLLQKREVWRKEEADTIITKMKSGIEAALMLDIVRQLPDFLAEGRDLEYTFAHIDITMIDDRRVNVISFEQNKYIHAPLFQGELYIDAENHALLKAVFKVNPKFVKSAADNYILRKKKDTNVTLESVSYEVSYKPTNDIYYINHIRGDLNFSMRKKRKLFRTHIHTWFEMVTCEIGTENVERIPRKEKVSPRSVFSNITFEYDPDFWGNFNTIMPEENLKKVITEYFSKK